MHWKWLTKGFPWSKRDSGRENDISQSLIGAIGDCRIHYQHQASFQTSPQPCRSVLAFDHLPACVKKAFSLAPQLRLLSGRDDRDRDRKDLRNSAGYGA
jgi:hypothetical protein